LYVTYSTSKSGLLIEKKYINTGATILLLLKEQTVQGTRPAVLEASTLINLGSRAKYVLVYRGRRWKFKFTLAARPC
jgi:hypothetical protein